MKLYKLGSVVPAILTSILSGLPQSPELRGWWVDAWHPGLRNPAEVEALVKTAREANFNALFVQVRRRGDAYYLSRFEPKSSEVQIGFDPLAHLIKLAHDTSLGPRVDVHAWIVTYNIWHDQLAQPTQPNHPYRLYPDWLTESYNGEKWDGANYAFDPGHPAVQEHTFNVAMDIIEHYDVDGLHFDYIRYAGRQWGYNPVAVTLFNSETQSTGRPLPDDSWWTQWRRDRVTALLRRVYIAAAAVKPTVKISAATITWTPSASTFPSWLRAAPWSDVLQDWRSWVEEGILDLNIPMVYFRQETHATAFLEWNRFAKRHRFNRHVAVGIAGYLNSISNTIVQIRNARAPAGSGAPGADGIVIYSYAIPARDASQSEFIKALTTVTTNAPASPPVFVNIAELPALPWKTNGSVSGVTGRVTDAQTGKPIAGAQVELDGSLCVLLLTDANGVYSRLLDDARLVSLTVSAHGYRTKTVKLAEPARVLVTNVTLQTDNSPTRLDRLVVSPGMNSIVLSWKTSVPTRGRVIIKAESASPAKQIQAFDNRLDTTHSVLVGELSKTFPPELGKMWLRVISELPGAETNESYAVPFLMAFRPIEINEWQVRLTGNWSFIEVPSAHGINGFWQTTTVQTSPTATAEWITTIDTPGLYDLEFSTFPSAGSFSASYSVITRQTNVTVRVNHSPARTNGVLLVNMLLQKGERPVVHMDNRTTDASTTIAASRIKWRYRPDQEVPASSTPPLWWVQHFFTETNLPTGDTDGDGSSNHDEFVLGTDPQNARSCPRLWLRPSTTRGWDICFSPVTSGRAYVLEVSTNLSNADWQPMENCAIVLTLDGDGVFSAIEPGSEVAFYRLKAKIE